MTTEQEARTVGRLIEAQRAAASDVNSSAELLTRLATYSTDFVVLRRIALNPAAKTDALLNIVVRIRFIRREVLGLRYGSITTTAVLQSILDRPKLDVAVLNEILRCAETYKDEYLHVIMLRAPALPFAMRQEVVRRIYESYDSSRALLMHDQDIINSVLPHVALSVSAAIFLVSAELACDAVQHGSGAARTV